MPHPHREDALEWLRFAEEDLAAARAMLVAGDPYVERHVGFAAQQAVEKALKALLIDRDTEPPRTHDLNKLETVLSGAPDERASLLLRALSAWSGGERYPFLRGLRTDLPR